MTSSFRSTKECISCFELIDQRARKCHHCAAIQARWANLDGNPWASSVIALLIIGLLGAMLYPILWGPKFTEYTQQLRVSVENHRIDETGDQPKVTCLGTIDNQSGHDWSNFHFEVRLTGVDNQLLDVFSTSDNALIAARNSSAAFRVQGDAARPTRDIRQCEIRITHAKVL